jgi:hypothetical protein
MNEDEMIERLNRGGGYVITYELYTVDPDRVPATGEIRFIIPLVPSPAEPLAAMVPLDPVRIVWTGAEWTRL